MVQLPPAADVSMHPPLEGHVDSPNPLDYGLDAPFWRTSMGQAIIESGVIRPSPGNPLLGEEEQRIINAYLDLARNFLERVERIVPPHASHHGTIFARLSHLSDPWPDGYRSLDQVLGLIEEVPFQGNPGPNDNPIV